MKRVALTTFGCKANQFDTAVIESLLRKEPVEIVDFSDEADFYVINSCSITAEADREARQFVRRAHKKNPSAQIIVTGCSAQVDPGAFEKMGIVRHVVGNEAKRRVVELIARSPLLCTVKQYPEGKEGLGEVEKRRANALPHPASPYKGEEVFYETPDTYSKNSRAFLKIQDGCSQFCSFCIVPFARGLNRSVSPDKVLESMHKLGRKGFNEIVLTGIHLGTYGHDLRPKTSLYNLMRRIESERPSPRVRISSVDPEELSHEMIDLIAASDIFCHHLHLPLQSGNDGILKKMRRRYTASHFTVLTERLINRIPDLCLGTDLIVGFPGEGEEEFRASLRLLDESPVHYIHTFPYSDRKGTKASAFADKVEPSVIRSHAGQIRGLSDQKRGAFYRNFIGRTLEAVVESRRGDRPVGLTRNYISVEIEGECRYSPGNLAMVRVDSTSQDGAKGVLA
ncbi:MAG: tRNA (N(6)-L-threonylcarbamoyladenosine(37)-C(2))-methylthiotransferase MtaB [Deltaproteobacteria bacterium]|nr:tRNA (N(6)-L-threonylcarbamoyladenosine(37)-C(2))-methylthiotransferase MtaB [Deltaproteobacteria bacterium]